MMSPQFTQDELKVMQNSLVTENEVRQGIVWYHHGVHIPKLVKKIDKFLPKERRFEKSE